jgi:hypothetical protein
VTRLSMYSGDDRDFTLTLTEDGAPMDLTGADVRFTAKANVSMTDEDAAIAKSTVDGGVVIDDDATSGVCVVTVDAADTDELGGSVLEYDVQVTRGGKTRTVVRNRLTISRDVSRTNP